jgi:ATP-dependent Lon protease
MAAKRANIKKLFIPAENRVNWADLDKELQKGIDVAFVRNANEVWQDIFPKRKTGSSSRKRARPAVTSPAGSH